jgi:predicted O-methyltransferase YrrM
MSENNLSDEIARLKDEIKHLKAELDVFQIGWPPGHYYSPIPSIKNIKQREHEIFAAPLQEIPGINLNEEMQLAIFEELSTYYSEHPFVDGEMERLRYSSENSYFLCSEAIFLYCMMRHLQPSSIVEIGSGYSSAAILDTNELFFDDAIICTFIEPYPEKRLNALIKQTEHHKISIVEQPLQKIDNSVFSSLDANDILFIDSTHVSKIDSDVNHIFFRILPSLASGVYIHFHDIFYPFEYPKEWIYQGRAWNEAYLLRAFLQYNNAYKIVFFNSFFAHVYQDNLRLKMPICAKSPGTSLWLVKV